MMQIAMEEGKYYVYEYEEIKEFQNIDKYFEINSKGNWENKIILIEKEKPSKDFKKAFRN